MKANHSKAGLILANLYRMVGKMLEPLLLKALAAVQIRAGETLRQMSQWVAWIIRSSINYPEAFLQDEVMLRDFFRPSRFPP